MRLLLLTIIMHTSKWHHRTTELWGMDTVTGAQPDPLLQELLLGILLLLELHQLVTVVVKMNPFSVVLHHNSNHNKKRSFVQSAVSR